MVLHRQNYMLKKIWRKLFPYKCLGKFRNHNYKYSWKERMVGTGRYIEGKEITRKISFQNRVCERCKSQEYHDEWFGWM